MAELKAMAERCRLQQVKTYIASGNVAFRSSEPEKKIKALLEAELAQYAGKPVRVLVRTAAEMAAIVAANPFPERAPDRTIVFFLDHPPPPDTLHAIKGHTSEEVRLGNREIYVYYGEGMGNSRLKIPAAEDGTARNLNTARKLAEMAKALSFREDR